MTKQETLAEIEADIRKDIPRLYELREGCILQNEWSKDFFKVYDETENHIRIFQLNSDVPNEQVINKKYINTYTPLIIIGHDIMLNDVLEWIKFNAFSVEFQENGDFNLYRELKLSKSIERYGFVNWNLSAPYIKEQSEELIKFLYNLIK